jgi:hypothetical protein
MTDQETYWLLPWNLSHYWQMLEKGIAVSYYCTCRENLCVNQSSISTCDLLELKEITFIKIMQSGCRNHFFFFLTKVRLELMNPSLFLYKPISWGRKHIIKRKDCKNTAPVL